MLIAAIKTLNSCLFQNFQPGSQVALWSDKRCWLLNFSGLMGEQGWSRCSALKTLNSKTCNLALSLYSDIDKRCWLLNFSGLLGEQKLPTVKTLHSCLPQNIQPLPLIGQDVDCCFQRRVKGLPTNSNTALRTEVLSINIQKGQGRYNVADCQHTGFLSASKCSTSQKYIDINLPTMKTLSASKFSTWLAQVTFWSSPPK